MKCNGLPSEPLTSEARMHATAGKLSDHSVAFLCLQCAFLLFSLFSGGGGGDGGRGMMIVHIVCQMERPD